MSVPLYWTEAGIPVGVHFGAAFGAEALLFSLAGQLEAASPWAMRRPKLSASTSRGDIMTQRIRQSHPPPTSPR